MFEIPLSFFSSYSPNHAVFCWIRNVSDQAKHKCRIFSKCFQCSQYQFFRGGPCSFCILVAAVETTFLKNYWNQNRMHLFTRRNSLRIRAQSFKYLQYDIRERCRHSIEYLFGSMPGCCLLVFSVIYLEINRQMEMQIQAKKKCERKRFASSLMRPI